MKILDYKKNKNTGFTLIELTVVMGIFSILGIVVLGVLINSLHSTGKSNLVATIRQNGDYALTQMAKQIRFATNVQLPSLPCNPPSSPTTSSMLTITDVNQNSDTYVCTAGSSATITQNGSSLLDTNTVLLSTCSFTCSQATPADSPVITINFSLKDNNNSKEGEQIVNPITFSTSIVLRNISGR